MNIDELYEQAKQKSEAAPKDYMTFDDWSADGYQIIKGSEAKKFGGVCYFHESQVKKVNWGGRGYDEESEVDYHVGDEYFG